MKPCEQPLQRKPHRLAGGAADDGAPADYRRGRYACGEGDGE